jgi:hypothetical protein
MDDRSRARAALLAHLDTASPDGGLSEPGFARLGELVAELSALTAYPRPAERPQVLAGRWVTVFAHFGARHSAGKPRVHESNLKIHSFNKFPELPISVLALHQEVAADGSRYDNVVSIAAPGGRCCAEVITHGRWVVDAHNPQRLNIEFDRVELRPTGAGGAAAVRAALAAPADLPLSADLNVGKLYSDVVYLDDELRINRGIQGGLYVLTKLSS